MPFTTKLMYPYPYDPSRFAPPLPPWQGDVYEETVVGAPEVIVQKSGSAFGSIAKVAIVVAGAVAIYFIYQASKTVTPKQKQAAKAAFKILGDEAKRTGRIAARQAGDAAASLVGSAIDRHVYARYGNGNVSAPKKVDVKVVRDFRQQR